MTEDVRNLQVQSGQLSTQPERRERKERLAMETQSKMGESNDPEGGQPRMFGGSVGSAKLPWEWATERLGRARNYWIATTRPNVQPHSRPVWGVWLDQAF